MINDYMSLSTRSGFNKSLAHFRLVTGILNQLNGGANLADVIDDLEKQKSVEKSQIAPILNAVLRDRMGYRALSLNLPVEVTDFHKIAETTKNWNRVDTVVAYHHPQLGITLLNPKDLSQWEATQDFNREELVVLYAKAVDESAGDLEQKALEVLRDLLLGRSVKAGKEFFDPALERTAPPPPPPPKPAARPAPAPATPTAAPAPSAAAAPEPEPRSAPEPAAAPVPTPGGKVRVTPKYSVQVTNELFHNGNVEAWKNIVESYKAKHPDLEVHIFHDGQKVNNINALFKWGKVKHGDVLLFSVSGEDIKGVAKLQRYLFEGASIRYNNFLKKDVNKVLNLF
jgi:hypothetical protein